MRRRKRDKLKRFFRRFKFRRSSKSSSKSTRTSNTARSKSIPNDTNCGSRGIVDEDFRNDSTVNLGDLQTHEAEIEAKRQKREAKLEAKKARRARRQANHEAHRKGHGSSTVPVTAEALDSLPDNSRRRDGSRTSSVETHVSGWVKNTLKEPREGPKDFMAREPVFTLGEFLERSRDGDYYREDGMWKGVTPRI